MKNLVLLCVAVFVSLISWAQDKPYTFTIEHDLARTEVKNQCRTGTCWSYSTVSFLESEVLRLTGKEVNLSEMFNVRMTYPKKAEFFLRYQGKYQFGPGSLCHDAIRVAAEHGVITEEAYPGHPEGETYHNHQELDAVLEAMVKAVAENRTASAGNAWRSAIEGTLDAYLGAVPATFTFEGKKYTPAAFRDFLKIKADDYVSLSSFSHHPFYDTFVLEVPDNFSQGKFHNLPIDQLEQIVINALSKGYTVAWDADVSERSFSFKEGVAIIPPKEAAKDDLFKVRLDEPQITQEDRQRGFDSYETTDDHLMHITGTAKDQNGTLYFIVKNSWGTENPYGGYQYVSSAYFRAKTVSVLLHKDAIPTMIRSRLSL